MLIDQHTFYYFILPLPVKPPPKRNVLPRSRRRLKLSQEIGIEAALQKIGDPNGPFVWKDTYVFCISADNGYVTAHPIKPKLVGKDLTGIKDINGKMFFLEFLNIAREKGEGWVSYMWPKPEEKEPFSQKLLCLSAGRWKNNFFCRNI